MADIGAVGSDAAVTFMVSAGLVYEIIAAACSSPQTTEINAGARSETLMKWVWMGLGQAALFVGVAAWISDEPWAALTGGGAAAVLMLGQYQHAKACGLASGKPGTESY
jgi:hypothetical protein